jgi:hypothetical protein
MAAKITVTLACDYPDCKATVETTATAVGKSLEKAKFEVEIPHDWFGGRRERGWGYTPEELDCGCPEHAKEMRGY